MKAAFATHLEISSGAIQNVSQALEDIKELLGDVKKGQAEDRKRDWTIRGVGTAGTFGGDSAYVRINADSDASVYQDGDRVRVTNKSVEGSPSEIFEVRGEWTHADDEVLVSFSEAACDILEVEGIVKVLLEPVIED